MKRGRLKGLYQCTADALPNFPCKTRIAEESLVVLLVVETWAVKRLSKVKLVMQVNLFKLAVKLVNLVKPFNLVTLGELVHGLLLASVLFLLNPLGEPSGT